MSMLLRFKSNIMLRQKLDYSQRLMLEQVKIIEKAEMIYYKSFRMSPRRYRKKLKRLDPSIATCLNIITVKLKVQISKISVQYSKFTLLCQSLNIKVVKRAKKF